MSFPRHANDIKEARELLYASGGHGGIVAKIERAEAILAELAAPDADKGRLSLADGPADGRLSVEEREGRGALSGLAGNYVRVEVGGDEDLKNRFVHVEIVAAGSEGTLGRAVPDSAW